SRFPPAHVSAVALLDQPRVVHGESRADARRPHRLRLEGRRELCDRRAGTAGVVAGHGPYRGTGRGMKARLDEWFGDTVSALAYSLVGARADGRPELEPPYNDLARFVIGQHGRMTDYLRRPLLALTLGFDVLAIARGGKRFHRLPPAERARIIATWKS